MLVQIVLLQPEKFKGIFTTKAICCNKLFKVEADLNEIICDDNGAKYIQILETVTIMLHFIQKLLFRQSMLILMANGSF